MAVGTTAAGTVAVAAGTVLGGGGGSGHGVYERATCACMRMCK